MHFQFIAHRGASYDAPENTLAAIQLAWDQGADAVEIDCRITRDGHAVVFHDPNTLRLTTIDKIVSDTSLNELRRLKVGGSNLQEPLWQQIPTLAEVIDIVPQGKRLFVEVKSSTEITRVLAKTLQEGSHTATELVVTSYDAGVLHGIRQQLPDSMSYLVARFVPVPESDAWTPTVQELLRTARLAEANGLNVRDHPSVDRKFCDEIAAMGLEVYVWTVDDPQRTVQLMEAGVAGVFTNRPGWLRGEVAPR